MSGEEEAVIFLEHHGIKGQKWGVRRKSKGSVKVSSDAKKVAPLKGRHVSTLTNKQLKTANERINLEQQYKRMNPNKVESGKRHVLEALATIGIAVSVFNLATSPAGKAAISAGKKALG